MIDSTTADVPAQNESDTDAVAIEETEINSAEPANRYWTNPLSELEVEIPASFVQNNQSSDLTTFEHISADAQISVVKIEFNAGQETSIETTTESAAAIYPDVDFGNDNRSFLFGSRLIHELNGTDKQTDQPVTIQISHPASGVDRAWTDDDEALAIYSRSRADDVSLLDNIDQLRTALWSSFP